MRLLDRVSARYRDQGYYEGLASGAAVLMTYGSDSKREPAAQNLVAAATQAYETNGVVFAVMLARMMLLSEATFKFRSLVDKHLFGNPDLQILEYPWPNATAGELWARMEQGSSLTGNAFVAKVDVDELLVLPAAEVTIVSEEIVSPRGIRFKRPIGYDWDPTRAQPGAKRDPRAQFFTVDEVAHWSPIPDPVAQFRGMSWLTPVLKEVNADSGMTHYKTMYMDHGTPVLAVKYPRPMKPETIDAMIDRIAAKYGGASNAWKSLIFDQGADPVMAGGLADLDFRAIQAGGELRICAAGGISPILIGLASAAPGESYQTAMRQFADMHIRPLWRSACAALQKLVPNIPAEGVQLWFDTSDIAALQAAETEKAQVTQVNAAAILTFIQAGMTRDSVISAVTSGDLSLLVPDPDAPTPGVQERETVSLAAPLGTDPQVVTTNDASSTGGTSPKAGQAPGVQTVLTKPQTGASKKPMPASIPTVPSGTGRRGPSTNGKGH